MLPARQGQARPQPLEVVVVQGGLVLLVGALGHPLEQAIGGRADALDQGSAGVGSGSTEMKRLGGHGGISVIS
jgi:hypothetical protein